MLNKVFSSLPLSTTHSTGETNALIGQIVNFTFVTLEKENYKQFENYFVLRNRINISILMSNGFVLKFNHYDGFFWNSKWISILRSDPERSNINCLNTCFAGNSS